MRQQRARRLVIGVGMAAILVVAGCRAGQPQDGYEAIVSAAVSDLGAQIEAFGGTLRSLNAVTGGGGVVALQASRASAKDAAAKVFQVRRSVGALDVPQDAEAFHDLVIQSMDAATQGFSRLPELPLCPGRRQRCEPMRPNGGPLLPSQWPAGTGGARGGRGLRWGLARRRTEVKLRRQRAAFFGMRGSAPR